MKVRYKRRSDKRDGEVQKLREKLRRRDRVIAESTVENLDLKETPGVWRIIFRWHRNFARALWQRWSWGEEVLQECKKQ